MLYDSRHPAPPLRSFVERLWSCSDAPEHRKERILPSGTVELVINCRDDEIRIGDPADSERLRRFSGAVVSGTYGRFFEIDPLQHAAMIGVHFRPGGASGLLGMPAGELADAHVDLGALWGPAAAGLRERLCMAVTTADRFAVLEQALLSRLPGRRQGHWAVAAALQSFEQAPEGVRVGDVARRIGVSQRRLIQVFAAEVGLRPKLYCRVQRFGRVREMIGRAGRPDWAAVAAACGYFDQSHMIRDFQEFAGLSPVEYFRQSTTRVLPNHVPQSG